MRPTMAGIPRQIPERKPEYDCVVEPALSNPRPEVVGPSGQPEHIPSRELPRWRLRRFPGEVSLHTFFKLVIHGSAVPWPHDARILLINFCRSHQVTLEHPMYRFIRECMVRLEQSSAISASCLLYDETTSWVFRR